METFIISASDFQETRNREDNFLGITNNLQQHLLKFYQQYTQNAIYRVVGTFDEVNTAMDGNIDFYKKFGIIMYQDGDTGAQYVDDKQFVWVVDGIVTTEDYRNACDAFGCSEIQLAAIMNSDSVVCSAEDTEIIISEVTESIVAAVPGITVWNTTTLDTAPTETSVMQTFDNSFNVLPILREYSIENVSAQENTRNLSLILDKLLVTGDADTILFLQNGTIKEKILFANLAAILVTLGRKVDIRGESITRFTHTCRQIHSKNYLYANDYLYKLANPPGIALALKESTMFACVRDGDLQSKYGNPDIQLQLYGVQFDCVQRKIQNKYVEVIQCKYNELEIYPMYEIFNFNSTDKEHSTHPGLLNKFSVAAESSSEVDTVIGELESLLEDANYPLGETTLNFTNVLIYECNGITYIGYLARAEAEYHYKFLPFSNKYQTFEMKLDARQYDTLLDVAILADGQSLVQRLRSFIGDQKIHFPIPRGVRGCALRALKTTSNKYQDECGFTFEEIGIWSTQTSQCRIGTQSALLRMFSRQGLRGKKFLSVWGGNHPAIITELLIDYSVWK